MAKLRNRCDIFLSACRQQFKIGKDVGSKLENVFGGGLQGKAGQDVWPNWMVRVWGVRNDPEALLGMVDDGDSLFGSGGDWPGAAQEVQCVISVETALDIERQM